MTYDIIPPIVEKAQETNNITVSRETDQEQKKSLMNELGNSAPKKPVLEIIREFKAAALTKLSELQSQAFQAGFIEADESVQSIVHITPDEFITTSEQSLFIDIQNRMKIFQEELVRAEELEIVFISLNRNEKGDAELFLRTYPNKYVFDTSAGKNGEFFFWNDTHWQIDSGKIRYLDMDKIADKYQWAADQISDLDLQDDDADESLRKELKNRAKGLRSARRCRAVFEFVSPEVVFKGEWDYCPGYLPCLNGLVNLSNGNIHTHTPERFIRTVCPTEYHPDAKSDLLDKFVDDIMLGDQEMKEFLARCLGSALIGDAKEEKIFYFFGKDGRNGKGSLMQALEKTLGKLARSFPSEMLLVQKNPPSSSSASPELAKLQGVRFAIFSEINKKREIDSSKVKNLSGRDTIPCRRLFSNEDLEITPSHTMFIQTNFKPEAPADDNALWKRNVLVPFNAEFVEEPKLDHQRLLDPKFKEKLFDERRSILSWLVHGCLSYQQYGLCIPNIVKEETELYRKENDGIGRFLEDMCVTDPVFSTQKSKMEKAIKEYCQANKCKVPSRNETSAYLKTRFQDVHRESGSFWIGVKIVDERETSWVP